MTAASRIVDDLGLTRSLFQLITELEDEFDIAIFFRDALSACRVSGAPNCRPHWERNSMTDDAPDLGSGRAAAFARGDTELTRNAAPDEQFVPGKHALAGCSRRGQRGCVPSATTGRRRRAHDGDA